MHILITGEVGVGKSTLIGKLLENARPPLYGFVTKKEAPVNGISPVYIHNARGARGYTGENLVALCAPDGARPFTDVFDTRGAALLRDIPEGALVLMDELGFLENQAERFQQAVLDAFCRRRTVIAAIKPRGTPFLNRIRAIENALLFHIDESNRDALYHDVLSTLERRCPSSPLLSR